MPNNPFSYSDEIGFEQNSAISTPKKAIADAAKAGAQGAAQQVKALAQDATNQFLDALYGSSTPSSDQQSDTGQQQSSAQGTPPSLQQVRQQLSTQQGGGNQAQTQGTAKPQMSQEQKTASAHKRYFETEVEQGMVKAGRQREEEEQKRLQGEVEERQSKEQEQSEQGAQFIAPTGKAKGAPGRNRKGQRPLAVRQSQTKAESGRNTMAG